MMTSVVHKIDFSHLSDDEEDEVDNGSEVSIISVSSSGCEADDSKNLSPSFLTSASATAGGGDSSGGLFLQKPAMTSSPRSSLAKCEPTPLLTRSTSRLLRHRAPAPSPATYGGNSPPYKRIKGLNLGDLPATPRTLLGNCMLPPENPPPSSLSAALAMAAGGGCLSPHISHEGSFSAELRPPSVRRSARKVTTRSRFSIDLDPASHQLPSVLAPLSSESDRQRTNVNPFTPRGRLLSGRKRLRDSIGSDTSIDRSLVTNSDCSMEELEPLSFKDPSSLSSAHNTSSSGPRRLSLAETEVSRFEREFAVQDIIGSGEFGCVFRCINRLDGCTYAVKRSHRTVAGGAHERAALNEVYAHAVLGQHAYIVRYYSAWSEQGHMLIQNEFCGRGSLTSLLDKHRSAGTRMTELQIRRMLVHVARGLRYIHSMRLCHLDLKPENIFITDNNELLLLHQSGGDGVTPAVTTGPAAANPAKHRRCRAALYVSVDDNNNDETSSDDGFEDDHDQVDEDVIYKIGDFGHVTSLDEPYVEEGDCRYMPREILREDYSQLDKADMFALGLTAVECASGIMLPKNGELWQQLRDGQLPDMPDISEQLLTLIRQMVDPDPDRRPDSAQLLSNGYLLPSSCRSRAQLRRQLADERMRNRQLRSQLAELGVFCGSAECSSAVGKNSSTADDDTTPHKHQHQECGAESADRTGSSRLVGRGALRSRSTNF